MNINFLKIPYNTNQLIKEVFVLIFNPQNIHSVTSEKDFLLIYFYVYPLLHQ